VENNSINIIYIVGEGRSGSTLIARILGEVDGFKNVGELTNDFYNLKQMNLNVPCECGLSLSVCPSWGDYFNSISEENRKIHTKYVRLRFVPALLGFFKTSSIKQNLMDLSDDYYRIFKNVAIKYDSKFIIDSSKHPANAIVLDNAKNLNVYLLHLVRDPRAIVSSFLKQKKWVKKRHPIKTAALWSTMNFILVLLNKKKYHYYRLLYEDFVRNPKLEIKKFLDHLNIDNELDFMHDNSVKLLKDHMISGNPNKLIHGWQKIERRKWQLAWHLKFITVLLTWPFILLYYQQYIFKKNNS
jgi:hypothetical protein